MSAVLFPSVVEDVRSGREAIDIVRSFNEVYTNLTYPPINVYRTLLLCAAVQHNHTILVDLLLQDEAYDINYTFGYVIPSPLHVAVVSGNTPLVERLIGAGAAVSLESRASLAEDGGLGGALSALECACIADRPDLLKLLLPHYSREQTRTKRTPLHLACQHGAYNCVDYLLTLESVLSDINALDSTDAHQPERYTPLMLALCHGAPIVRRLLEAGASASHVTERTARTVLQLAVTRTDQSRHGFIPIDLPDVLRLLLEADVGDVNTKDLSRDTALSVLCTQVKCVVTARTDVFYPYDITDHHQSVVDAMHVLLDAGADPNCSPRQQPLAVISDMLTQMITTAVQLHLQEDNDGCSVMTHITSVSQGLRLAADLFSLLLTYEADPNVTGCRDERRLILAVFENLTHIFVAAGSTEHHLEVYNDCMASLADIIRHLILSGATFDGLVDKFALATRIKRRFTDAAIMERCVHMILCTFHDSEMFVFKSLYNIFAPDGIRSVYYMIENVRQSLSLKSMSRAVIIRAMSRRSLKGVTTLGLPATLERYVLFSN